MGEGDRAWRRDGGRQLDIYTGRQMGQSYEGREGQIKREKRENVGTERESWVS